MNNRVNICMGKVFNQSLDNLVRPHVLVLRRSRSAFRVCGFTGFALTVVLATTLAMRSGLSPAVVAALIVAAMLTFFGLIIATDEELFICYHYEIALMIVTALLLWLLRQPVLTYFDVTILCIGVSLACGRVGCLMVGCCHGRPYHWGVCYRTEHAEVGFPSYYIGVRLFPIQAVESLWVLCIVIAGSLLVLSGQPPGYSSGLVRGHV